MAVTDRDHFIAVSSSGKKELLQKPISKEMEQVIANREKVMTDDAKGYVPVANEEKKYACEVICPIIVEGDVMGSVILLTKNNDKKFGAAEENLVTFAANFLGKQMEQ